MSIQTNSPDSNLAASLSADDMPSGISPTKIGDGIAVPQRVIATGGPLNYVATPAVPVTLVNDLHIIVQFPTVPDSNATLNVSDTGAKTIYINSNAAGAIISGNLLADVYYELSYSSVFGVWITSLFMWIPSLGMDGVGSSAFVGNIGFFSKTPIAQPSLGAFTYTATWDAPQIAALQALHDAIRALGLGS